MEFCDDFVAMQVLVMLKICRKVSKYLNIVSKKYIEVSKSINLILYRNIDISLLKISVSKTDVWDDIKERVSLITTHVLDKTAQKIK